MAKFNIPKSSTNERSLQDKAKALENKDKFDIRFIEVGKIIPNPDNFYELSEIDSLANNIKEFGLMQNLEVLELEGEEGEEKQYRLIGGHRRFEAIKKLIEQGEVFDTLPCKVERGLSAVEEKLRLIKSNSDTRELTSKEKRLQVELLTELYSGKKADGEKINVKKEVAEATGNYPKTVERYDNINKKLIPELQGYFDDNKITFTEAYNFATLDEKMQLAILEILNENNKVSKDELNAIRNQNNTLKEEAETKEKQIAEIKKELEGKEKQISTLEKEKGDLELEVSNTSIEQEVLEEEKKKLEEKIREEVTTLTEEEINKTKEKLEKATQKTKELEEKEKELKEQLKTKEEEHKIALEEYKTNLKAKEENSDDDGELKSVMLNRKEFDKEVAKVKINDIKSNVAKELIEIGNILKKNEITDGVDSILIEIEKAINVLKNKINNISKKAN